MKNMTDNKKRARDFHTWLMHHAACIDWLRIAQGYTPEELIELYSHNRLVTLEFYQYAVYYLHKDGFLSFTEYADSGRASFDSHKNRLHFLRKWASEVEFVDA